VQKTLFVREEAVGFTAHAVLDFALKVECLSLLFTENLQRLVI
jgi:hypothetical protein